MKILSYQREKAIAYAHQWSHGRNPAYLDFSRFGGDCTNFISQCLYAGCKTMNGKSIYGWYYYNGNNRSASWTGVEYLNNFLTGNEGLGPFAKEVSMMEIEPADIIQLSFDGFVFRHSLFVVEKRKIANQDHVKIATHTFDRDYYPLTNYTFRKYRCLHIEGYRK